MKILFSLMLLTIAQVAQASVCDLTWEQLYRRGYSSEFNKIQFGTVFVPADEVCIDDDNLKTLYPVEVCLEYGRGEAADCIRYEKKNLRTPIRYEKEIPDSEGGYKKIWVSYPLNFNVPVGRMGEGGLHIKCYKPYSTPSCQ